MKHYLATDPENTARANVVVDNIVHFSNISRMNLRWTKMFL